MNTLLQRTRLVLAGASVMLGVAAFAPAANADECMIGEMRMFAGNFAPKNWALAEGQLLPISQNTALFSVLGTMYGGDGRTTFALPDMRGRAAIGAGQGVGLSLYQQGQKIGNESVTLNATHLPSHNHNVATATTRADLDTYSDGNTTIVTGPGSGTTLASSNVGGSAPVSVMQPSLAVPYIICTTGIFPSRN